MSQYCPVCKTEVHKNERYTNYVCSNCVANATDIHGNKVEYSNVDILGGVKCTHKCNQNKICECKYECYIDGIKCIASEARFGGIVIQPISET